MSLTSRHSTLALWVALAWAAAVPTHVVDAASAEAAGAEACDRVCALPPQPARQEPSDPVPSYRELASVSRLDTSYRCAAGRL